MAKSVNSLNPAEIASAKSLTEVFSAIDSNKCFLLEAGAGAGKTYSLVKALRYVIEKRGISLMQKHQQVACITYTNVASDEISTRTDRHPAILSSTIHAFCWALIRGFQPALREKLPGIGKWSERLAEANCAVGDRDIVYELGYPKIQDENTILLGHDDVIELTVALMESNKFRDFFVSKYPVLFIDEYQDTNKEFATALIRHFLNTPDGLLIGFFGDHWQKIYGDGCGKIDNPSLVMLGKGANFRSVPAIVDVLNRMRPGLQQFVQNPDDKSGFIAVYHTNGWSGARRTGQHWQGDLPPEDAHRCFTDTKANLVSKGWDFDQNMTKILMLTHSALAKEQGYGGIASALDNRNDRFIKKEDPYIKFLVETIEPACAAYEQKHFGEMFEILRGSVPLISSREDKASWAKEMDVILGIRSSGTIGSMIDALSRAKYFHLPEAIIRKEAKLTMSPDAIEADERESVDRSRALRDVQYAEIIPLTLFINDQTPFSTKHGVKGAEFENVLVVFGRGWNQYDFDQMLGWEKTGVPNDKRETFERNRNLFYVVCSRPKQRLALLFTQQLSSNALATLSEWFGAENIHPII